MHPDEARQNRVAIQVQGLRIRWYFGCGTRLNRLDLSAADDDCLVLFGCGSGAVDHAHMGQRNHGRFRAYELLALGSLCERGRCNTEQQEKQEEFDFHFAVRFLEFWSNKIAEPAASAC